MKRLIFIYGFEGYQNQSKTAKDIFSDYDFLCFEYNSKLKQPIEEIAKELSSFINNKTNKDEKVNLVGVSAGGIIAEYYARFLNPKKVDKLATVCSPFHGTYAPLFYSKERVGLKELSYNSDFLKKLNSKKLDENKTINFYSFFDILVPFNSGKGENPIHTWNFFHFTIQKDKKILNKIKSFFEK